MAPEIVLEEFASIPQSGVVLDPMTGSGTVLREASERGFTCIGYDLDPLAVLMSRVWNTPIDVNALRAAVAEIAETAESLDANDVVLPWVDSDPPTQAFIDFWFGAEQKRDLLRISSVLSHLDGPISDALRIAMSRIIITKDRGASLARDVSHSRPHRVFAEFVRSVEWLALRLERQPPKGRVSVYLGDARNMSEILPNSIDAVITSPPYLNALDYMRGHKLALVWLGYKVSDFQAFRASSIGAERGLINHSLARLVEQIGAPLVRLRDLPKRERAMVDRYVLDLLTLLAEIHRILRLDGKAVLVVGNSCIRGVFVENTLAVTSIAKRVGLKLEVSRERDLPPNRRYLPPPTSEGSSSLQKRMRTETVLTFRRAW
jgi:SAM-dependent methyltransferase